MTHLLLAAAFASGTAPHAILRTDHAAVSYEGVNKAYAAAIARTVGAARAVAAEAFGFDMPETIRVKVDCDAKSRVRLFTDGQDSLFLTVRSERDLRKPSTSGVFHVYGLCHEVGHLAMYRPIREHAWMTSAAAEGWAHYLGSRLVDAVHKREGVDLWPDAHDYLAFGTARLNKQTEGGRRVPVVQGAALWRDLTAVVGDKGMAPVFKAWGQAQVDPADPGAALRRTLLATHTDPRLADWWNQAEPLFVIKRARSGFKAKRVNKSALAGAPIELSHDDGASAGRGSIAGGGHAVRFEAPGPGWHVIEVSIHGSRYGYPRPPRENFHVWLCDADCKAIADFPFPYARFRRGAATWVKLPVRPTETPRRFVICVGFNPTARKGVFVSRDKQGSGHSLIGLPGGEGRTYGKADWLIRVKLDQLKSADALREMR